MINEKEFYVLTTAESSEQPLSQRNFARKTGYSIGTINSLVASLEERGLLSNGKITEKGLDCLSPYRVKRIVFIAAGFGTRLVPITLNTPKPLVRVHGKRIIDTMLDNSLMKRCIQFLESLQMSKNKSQQGLLNNGTFD